MKWFGSFTLAALAFLCSGCVQLALRSSPTLFPKMADAIFEECDSKLAEQSFPADLKLMEGLLKFDPENDRLLTALCMGYTGYGMLFVEEADPGRASLFFLRAKEYGLKALGEKGAMLQKKDLKVEEVKRLLRDIKGGDLQPLLWTATAWNAWINLNLDRPAALAELGIAEASVERALEMDPTYFHGMPYVLMGAILAAKPPMMGGDVGRSQLFFRKALDVSRGDFFLAQYYYAKHYAVRVQDRTLFSSLLKEIVEGRVDALEGSCLINAVMKEKAERLIEKTDELFY